MQRRARRRDLGYSPLDRRVDVLIRVEEDELARLQLALDSSKRPLDGGQLRFRQESRRRQATAVRDAPGNVERVKLEIHLERR